MLNTFPSLLTYGLVAPFIIRVVLGGIFIWGGYIKIVQKRAETERFFTHAKFPKPILFAWIIGLIELLGGIALVAGFGTQIASILIAVISLGGLIIKIRHPNLLSQTIDFYIFAIAMSLSLTLTGAGFLAFDLPL